MVICQAACRQVSGQFAYTLLFEFAYKCFHESVINGSRYVNGKRETFFAHFSMAYAIAPGVLISNTAFYA